jgi:hypothetical protein
MNEGARNRLNAYAAVSGGTILLESSRGGENKEERSVRRTLYEDRKFQGRRK